MSIWAERFAALSRPHDNSDNSDKRSGIAKALKTAETLASEESARPFVPFVAFVKGGTERGAEQPPTADQLSKPVLTKADKRSDEPRSWREGFTALRAMPAPSGFPAERWRRLIHSTGKFLAHWGADAERLEWTTLDVFGAHETAPAARFDCMGLVLLLDRVEVVAVDAKGADLVTITGARQRFRRRPLPPGTVPLWKVAP